MRGPRKVRTRSFVSSNPLGKEILIFYKNTFSQAECLMLRNIQVTKDERHNSPVEISLVTQRHLYILKE